MAANVVAGQRTSNDTENKPPSVSVSLVKTNETSGMNEIQRYLDQQNDLIRNVQNVNNAVISIFNCGHRC